MSANGESLFPAPSERASSLQSQVAGSGSAFQLTSKKVDEDKHETSVLPAPLASKNTRKKMSKRLRQQYATIPRKYSYSILPGLFKSGTVSDTATNSGTVSSPETLTTGATKASTTAATKASTTAATKASTTAATKASTTAATKASTTAATTPIKYSYPYRYSFPPGPLSLGTVSDPATNAGMVLNPATNAGTVSNPERLTIAAIKTPTIAVTKASTTAATKASTAAATKTSTAAKKRRRKHKRKQVSTNKNVTQEAAVENQEGIPAEKRNVEPNVQGQVTNATPKKKKRNKRRKKKSAATARPIITAQEYDQKENKVSGVVGDSGSVVTSGKVASGVVQQMVGGSGQTVSDKKKRRNERKQNLAALATLLIEGKEDATQKSDEPMAKKRKVNISGRPVGISSNRPKTAETPVFNPTYGQERHKEEIQACWSGKGGMRTQEEKEDAATVIKDPFTCCYLPAFLSNPTFLDKVCEELQDLEMTSKNNDLYKFEQSSDLKTTTSPHLAGLRRFLYGELREWLIQVTGIPLTPMVDMSCSKYQYTDVLLCHDDELEHRRVAFILYLVPPWCHEDGGTLDLFDVDAHGQPTDVVHSIVPHWNTFAFFEVSPVSFHQVSEVVSRNKARLTINGWFYGPTIERPEKYVPPPIPLLPPGHVEEEEVYSWINPQYLEPKIQHQVQKEFAEKSALELDNFFTSDRFAELAQALHSLELPWTTNGPANRQSCLSLEAEAAPEVVRSAVELLKSEAMFLVLSQLTGLRLHSLAPPDSDPDSDEESGAAEPNPRVSVSINHWGHGHYTLVRDDCVETVSALDARLFVNVPVGWTQKHGGFVSYIAKDEDEELLTVVPKENCLALVYRDAETLSFTKYINHCVTELDGAETSYQTLTGVYYE